MPTPIRANGWPTVAPAAFRKSSCAFARAAIPFRQVTGMLDPEPDVREPSESAWAEIAEWCAAAKVVHNLRQARIGYLGHPYPGMLDMYSDFTQHQAQLGTHIEVLEMCDLEARVERRDGRRDRAQGGGNPRHL